MKKLIFVIIFLITFSPSCFVYGAEVLNSISDGKVVEYIYKTNNQVKFYDNEVLSERTSNSITYYNQGKKHIRFFVGQPFIKENETWYYTQTATSTPESFKKIDVENESEKLLNWFIKPVTAQSYFSHTADGFVQYMYNSWGGQQANWDTAHDAETGTGYDNSDSGSYGIMSQTEDGNLYIRRSVFSFNTSDLADDSVIDSASLFLYVYAKTDGDDDGNDFVRLVSATPASDTSLGTADYDQFGATAGATDIDIGDITTDSYNEFILNSTGLDLIDLEGYTVLGLREGHDVLDDMIANGVQNNVGYWTADKAGTDYDPYLDITLGEAEPEPEPESAITSWLFFQSQNVNASTTNFYLSTTTVDFFNSQNQFFLMLFGVVIFLLIVIIFILIFS